jgi:large subunit ribosomal protein L15
MDLTTVHEGVHKLKTRKRVGRGPGSGHGKTASRGSKGQWASAGAKKPTALFEGGQMQLFRRMPKRGFSQATWRKKFLPVNLGDLDARFQDGDAVDHAALRRVGLANGPADGVKILGTGELTKKLTVSAHHFSKSAAEKIAARGGTVTVIPGPKRPKRNKMGSRLAAFKAKDQAKEAAKGAAPPP